MATQQKIRLPLHLVILDGIGASLAAIGLGELIGEIELVPNAFKFNNYQIIMIVIGIALMIPSIISIRKRAKGDMPRNI